MHKLLSSAFGTDRGSTAYQHSDSDAAKQLLHALGRLPALPMSAQMAEASLILNLTTEFISCALCSDAACVHHFVLARRRTLTCSHCNDTEVLSVTCFQVHTAHSNVW